MFFRVSYLILLEAKLFITVVSLRYCLYLVLLPNLDLSSVNHYDLNILLILLLIDDLNARNIAFHLNVLILNVSLV